ncbi:hypothetical protein NC652_004428 [Populus alba x Populus x berolinensis]|nr:hypothetical protein NC652_004428 [Populus alba x Populus x berolinensis]
MLWKKKIFRIFNCNCRAEKNPYHPSNRTSLVCPWKSNSFMKTNPLICLY